MKEFVHFSTTDVFVPVSQLSTRDLFDFLEKKKTFKLSKTYFCLEFLVLFDRSNKERYDSPIPDFWNKSVQENVNS